MSRAPIIGCSFDPDQSNETENIGKYIDELRYYRPRGFSKLAREGEAFLNADQDDAIALDGVTEWMSDCDSLLTDWARKVARNDYLCFGPFEHGGAVGFYVRVDGFLEDCNLQVADLGEVPAGFSGLVAQVSDHGNVEGYSFNHGRKRSLFAVV